MFQALGRQADLDMQPMQPGDVKDTYADITELKQRVRDVIAPEKDLGHADKKS